jgi:ABC-type dipeptide/oligopeptide/nickel transport system ATPase subunit
MSSHRTNKGKSTNKSIDYLIRWALHDSVADAEPSPQIWERIQERITDGAGAVMTNAPAWHEMLLRRLLNLYLAALCSWNLSDDNWQRVALARALVVEPSLLKWLNLYLAALYPWNLSGDNWQRVTLAQALAAGTALSNGWGLRCC